MRKFFLCIGLLLLFVLYTVAIQADEYDDITKQLSDLKKSLDTSQKATQTNEKNMQSLNQQLESIKNKVYLFEQEIIKKEKEVRDGETALRYQKILLEERTVSYYKNLDKNTFTVIDLLIAKNLSLSLQNFFYQKTLLDEDRKTIVNIVTYIKDLEKKKASLQIEKTKMTGIREEVDKQSKFLATEVEKSKQYESSIQQKIAALSARQQQIIAQKLASLNIPRSAGSAMGGCVDDRNIDPGFSPRFAFYTYGVPDRVGMSQWGAYGRSKAGQDYKTILNAYFNNVKFECRSFSNNKIKVQGYGEIGLRDYLKGLGEMFSSWGDSGGYEAFKAQVVAAASFAYAYTKGGANEICTTQSCQVYLGHAKGGKWDEAVDDVNNKCGDGVEVIVSNDTNDVANAWYSSTFGGYSKTSGEVWGGSRPWTKNMRDTSGDVSSFGDLNERAYDKESPWFYCDWGSRAQYNKTAWLKPDEVADIANALLLAKSDPSTQNHLAQPDKPNPDGEETWSPDKVKSELRSRGKNPINNASDVSISWDASGGRTTSITVSGDGNSYSFDGAEFKSFFNLRAPANIQIVGPLYNVEKK